MRNKKPPFDTFLESGTIRDVFMLRLWSSEKGQIGGIFAPGYPPIDAVQVSSIIHPSVILECRLCLQTLTCYLKIRWGKSGICTIISEMFFVDFSMKNIPIFIERLVKVEKYMHRYFPSHRRALVASNWSPKNRVLCTRNKEPCMEHSEMHGYVEY